jgi:hypothetical protein
MELLNSSSNILMGWWPVIVSLWGIITAVLGLYSRIINLRLQAVSGDLTEVSDSLDKLVEKVDEQEKAFTNYQLQILRDYMPAADIKELIADLKSYLVRIEGKVDGRKAE